MWFAQAEPTLYGVPVTTDSTNTGVAAGVVIVYLLLILVLTVAVVAAYWKMFEKAGEAGWKALIPFYNTYTLFRIAGRNGWGFLFLLIPLVNIVVMIMIALDLAKHFGKSQLFGIVGLWLFSAIGYLILGFGDSKYVGVKHD